MTIVQVYYPYNIDKLPQNVLIRIMLSFGKDITLEDITQYYVCVHEMKEEKKIENPIEYLNRLWELFNSDDNPLSDKKFEEIEKLHTHTSMSVGDAIKIDDTYYVVSGSGFRKLDK